MLRRGNCCGECLDAQCDFCSHCASCGTSSRARERPVSLSPWGPAPLRSVEYPWGLPSLRGKDAFRVLAAFCRFFSDHDVKWSVENPSRSYMWELGPFIELLDVAAFYDFDACMHGGSVAVRLV